MLTHKATAADIAEWKEIFEACRGRLSPNRRSGEELAAYLRARYPVSSLSGERELGVVRDNVLRNECFKEKLPEGKAPRPVAFMLKDKETDIFIGVELETGYFLVEGVERSTGEFCAEKTERLYDELVAFRGWTKKTSETFIWWRNTSARRKCGNNRKKEGIWKICARCSSNTASASKNNSDRILFPIPIC